MTKNQTKNNLRSDAAPAAIGALGMFLCLPFLFWAFGHFERTATQPLMALTVNQAACEYVARAGVAIAKHDSICQIKVRYRRDMWHDGGTIQLDKGGSLELGPGQVVGMAKLDDGSNEPWTDEHKLAAALLAVPIGAILFFMWVMTLTGKRSEPNA